MQSTRLRHESLAPSATNDVDRTSLPHTRGHKRAVSCVGFEPPTQISRMSCKARAMASMKPSVEVSLHDLFDSIPNFIKSGPAKSEMKNNDGITNTNRSRQRHLSPSFVANIRKEREPPLTIYPIPIRIRGTKTRASKLVSSAQPTRTQFPRLAPLE